MAFHNELLAAAGSWGPLVLLVAAAVAVGYLFEKFVLSLARRLAQRTTTEIDDILYKSLHPAILLLIVATVLWAGVGLLGPDVPAAAVRLVEDTSLLLLIALAAFIASRLFRGLIHLRARKAPRFQPAAVLTSRIGAVVLYIAAFLMVLDHYGLDITPLLTTAGLATLAIVLALQDTLSNFFAGVWIQTGRALRPGHFVRLEEYKVEGYVAEVGWRTTQIRALPNYMFVIPNSKLAQSVVIDYYLPVPRMALLINVKVGYESDPDEVERVVLDLAKAGAKDIPGLLADPEPFLRWIPGFGEYALEFTLICQVREFVDQFLVQHELRKRILRRFREEGIRIPIPTRENIQRAGPPADEPHGPTT